MLNEIEQCMIEPSSFLKKKCIKQDQPKARNQEIQLLTVRSANSEAWTLEDRDHARSVESTTLALMLVAVDPM